MVTPCDSTDELSVMCRETMGLDFAEEALAQLDASEHDGNGDNRCSTTTNGGGHVTHLGQGLADTVSFRHARASQGKARHKPAFHPHPVLLDLLFHFGLMSLSLSFACRPRGEERQGS